MPDSWTVRIMSHCATIEGEMNGSPWSSWHDSAQIHLRGRFRREGQAASRRDLFRVRTLVHARSRKSDSERAMCAVRLTRTQGSDRRRVDTSAEQDSDGDVAPKSQGDRSLKPLAEFGDAPPLQRGGGRGRFPQRVPGADADSARLDHTEVTGGELLDMREKSL